MSFPSGIITRTLTFGVAKSLVTGEDLSMRLSITPTRSMVWTATGDPLIALLETAFTINGSGSISVPVTDQTGWSDGRGNQIVPDSSNQTHAYKIVAHYYQSGRSAGTATKMVAVPEGDGSPIDVDDLIPASGSGGVSVYIPNSFQTQINSLSVSVSGLDTRLDSLENAKLGTPVSNDGSFGLPLPTGLGLEFIIVSNVLEDITMNGVSL